MAASRVIMVVGMHRAGTSALTRGLTAIGVDLGEDLLLPDADNPKGYWENRAIVNIDDRLLRSVGHSWSSYGLFATEPATFTPANPLFFEAVQLIRESTLRSPIWGFKDPRSARLLPFWQAVFQHIELPVSYVIALRNPLSVARSLSARNGFAPQKSHLLWLEHYVCAFKYTGSSPVVVVDYDRLLDEPVREFERVTTRFGLLPECSRELAQEEYRLQFLEYGLRHTQFAVQDVAIAPCILKHTAELYRWGYKLATDQTSTDDEDFCQFLVKVESIYREFVPAMRYVNVLETELSQANAAQEAYRGQIEQAQETCKCLDAVVAAREARIAELESVLAERDRTLNHLQATLQEHQTALAQKNNELAVQRFTLEDKDHLIAAYEAERRTFGAQVGRWLSRQRNAWAPPPSPQGKILGLMIRAVRILHREGVIPFIRKAKRAGLHRVNPQRWPAVDWLHSSGLYDTVYYLETYPEVAGLRMDPADHYIRFGWQEGRNPHALFDTSFYLTQNPDVAQAGVDPLLHYVTLGWKEGRDPHPLFDTAFYLAHNPDVAQAGVPPLLHYISHGWQEGRAPHRLFDTQFYLALYPDVGRSGKNPLQHFVTQGWKEEHDPHPLFDMSFYLESQPDIRAQNINPAMHYASVIKTQRAYNSDYQKSPFPPYVRPRVRRIPHTMRVVIGAVTYNNASAEHAQYRDSLLLAIRELSERHSFSFTYIDNGTESYLSSMDSQFVQLPSRGNIGFGAAHNDMLVDAFQAQNADLYICANPDGVFHRCCLRHLIDMHAQFPHALIEARQFPEEHPKYYHPTKLDTHWASGCCLLIPRAMYQVIGSYDPHFFLYMEDVDYSWRARLAGFHVKMCPNALFGHHVLGRPESTSTKRHFLESGRYLAWKWGNHAFQQSCETALIQDKYYNCYAELPGLPPELKMALTPQEQEEICTFDKGFSFSYARW